MYSSGSVIDGGSQAATPALLGLQTIGDYNSATQFRTSPAGDFGLIYTNRTGAQKELKKAATRPCYYPHYALYIDWNGDVLLCCQDMYNRTVKFGNVVEKPIFNIWRDKRLKDFRDKLKNGQRCLSPCSNCDANGMLFGKNHAAKW